MRHGFFPGQLDALRELARDGLKLHEERRKSRRTLFALGLGAVAAGVGGFFVGYRPQVDAPSAEPAGLALTARELACAPDSELVSGARTFLMAVETLPSSDIAWCGAARLARLASAPSVIDPALRQRLRATAGSPNAPAWVQDAIRRIGG